MKKAKKLKLNKEVDDTRLRAHGYMTIEEFIEILTPGLKDYMLKNWSFTKPDDLHHPADLASTASFYMDGLYSYIETFGVQPVRDKTTDRIEDEWT